MDETKDIALILSAMSEVEPDGPDDHCVVLFSGGMDSATLLYLAIQKFGKDNVHPVSFKYASKHNKFELEAGQKLLDHLGMKRTVFDLTGAFEGSHSHLLLSGGDVPDSHYTDAVASQTVVPGRNTIFLSVAAGFAESQNIRFIYFGAHAGDHTIYPDCREDYVDSIHETLSLSSDGGLDVRAPFVRINKNDIASIGAELGVPWELTRSCYKNQEKPCGTCPTCVERIEALGSIGVTEDY